MSNASKKQIWDFSSEEGIKEFYFQMEKWSDCSFSSLVKVLSPDLFLQKLNNNTLSLNHLSNYFLIEAQNQGESFGFQEKKTMDLILSDRIIA